MTLPKSNCCRTASKIERMAAEREAQAARDRADRVERFTTYQSVEEPSRPPVTLPRLRFMER